MKNLWKASASPKLPACRGTRAAAAGAALPLVHALNGGAAGAPCLLMSCPLATVTHHLLLGDVGQRVIAADGTHRGRRSVVGSGTCVGCARALVESRHACAGSGGPGQSAHLSAASGFEDTILCNVHVRVAFRGHTFCWDTPPAASIWRSTPAVEAGRQTVRLELLDTTLALLLSICPPLAMQGPRACILPGAREVRDLRECDFKKSVL